MLKRSGPLLSLAHISLLFAGLMWVLPFLNYYHTYPLTTFYQEWSAGVLGLCAIVLLLSGRYWQQPEIPRVILLPVGMLMLVVVQLFLGRFAYQGQALLYALYLLWAALLVMLGRQLRQELGLAVPVAALAVALLAGGELNALAGLLQHYRWHTFLDPVVTAKISAAVYGNIAQPNHFADYLTLGLASLGLLYVRGLVRGWFVVVLALPLLYVLPLSGSRSTWLYLVWMAGLAYWWQRRDESRRLLLRYSLSVLGGFALMNLVAQLPWLAGFTGNVTTVQRLFGQVDSGAIRLHLWYEAWLIFERFPLLGAGFGQFAWQHFQLAPLLRDTGISGLYNNAHNLVLQLAAVSGLAGLLVLFGTLLPWIRRASLAESSPERWWGYVLLSVLGIHSLLEYPLWYAYFMGIAALLLGMFDTAGYRLDLRRVGRVSVALMLLLGVLSLRHLQAGYHQIETLVALQPSSNGDQTYLERVGKELQGIGRQPLLQPYASLFIDSMMDTGSEHIADKLAYNEAVLHFVPISTVAYRQALLLAQDGREREARTAIERAIWAYPGDYPQTERQLRELADRQPARFAALLKFAVRKYEEYLSAVHQK